MARQTGRRRAWIAFGLVAGIGVISVGAWALDRWKPFADDAVAVTWPENIQPLATYVEHTTGLQFLSPVTVVYLADKKAFDARVNARIEHSDADRTAAAADEAMGRALGFWDDSLAILDRAADLRAANPDEVGWDPVRHAIVVHAKGATADLTVAQRAALVLQLTESLDEQHYDISARLQATTTAQQYQALAALDVGQAIWVRDQWADDLTGDDIDDYERLRNSGGQDYADSVRDISPAFRSLRIAPQIVGVPFVKAMHQIGRDDAVALALQGDTPDAIDQLSLPVSKYERRDTVEPVEAPPTPTGGTFIQHRQLGPFGLYMVLAGGLPATEALTASDGWGNDAVTQYHLGGRTCLDARIVADSRTDADRIERGLNAWGSTRPKEAAVLVGRDGTTLLLSACDPGDATQPIIDGATIDQWFSRAEALGQQIDYLGLPDLAECSTIRFFEQFTASAWQGRNADFDPVSELDGLTSECAKSR